MPNMTNYCRKQRIWLVGVADHRQHCFKSDVAAPLAIGGETRTNRFTLEGSAPYPLPGFNRSLGSGTRNIGYNKGPSLKEVIDDEGNDRDQAW